MFRYLAVNLIVMAFVGTAMLLKRVPAIDWSKIALLAVVLIILTAIFDSLLVGIHYLGYQTTHILGIYIGKAPLEDFCYTLVVVVLLPYLWNYFGPTGERSHREK